MCDWRRQVRERTFLQWREEDVLIMVTFENLTGDGEKGREVGDLRMVTSVGSRQVST